MKPSEISKVLNSACELLKDQEHQQLVKDAHLTCQQLVNPHFGIAVLAPFNFGKSTLINALLGSEIMPTKMVRTTGSVIKVKYGKTLTSVITLESGEVIKSSDTKILKEFAVLNRKGQRREDVISIEVTYPHNLLKGGIELFDLPGTNDQEAQNALVRDQLLKVDLIIQVLNARQPFTLLEQETLRKWLDVRGIKTVVFALNRLNELENRKDRNEVFNDAYSTVKLFQPDLPQGIKELYRVDALPAIRAKQEGNVWKSIASGIVTFEAALFTIISLHKKIVDQTRLQRVIAVADQIEPILRKQADRMVEEISIAENARKTAIEIGKKREAFFRDELIKKVDAYRRWLSLDTLLGSYQTDAAQALESNQFYKWQSGKFQPAILSYVQVIENWVNQSCEEFQTQPPEGIKNSLPSAPRVSLPQRQERNVWQWAGDIFNRGENRRRLDGEYERKKWQAYKNSIYKYFSEFSRDATAYLNKYEKNAESSITFSIPLEDTVVIQKQHTLKTLNSLLDQIKSIKSLEGKVNTQDFFCLERLKVLNFFWKNYFLFLLKIPM